MKRLRQDAAVPPNYAVGAYTCDVYASDVLMACEKQCRARK